MVLFLDDNHWADEGSLALFRFFAVELKDSRVPIGLDPQLFSKVRSLRGGYQRQCFERRIIDHQRILFRRRGIGLEGVSQSR